jgi:feruloyl esterase
MKRTESRGYGAVQALFATLLLVGAAHAHEGEPHANAAPAGPADLAARCEALNLLNLEAVGDAPARIVATSDEPALKANPRETLFFKKRGNSQGNPTPKMATFPPHCYVEGYVTPHVQFSMRLPPPDTWNGNFMLAACDAWCGKVHTDITVPGLNDGYATLTNNGGHYSRAPFDGIWAHKDITARINFAHLANHTSAQVGKAIAAAYYGKAPRYSYITGFSKGGNAGLMAAQRYPEDFDGAFIKAPVVDYNAKNAVHLPWMAKAVYPVNDNTPVLYSDKVPLLSAAVTKACDSLDGLEDGVLDDPRLCKFDARTLLCKAGQSEAANECLSAAQVEAVRKMYSKPYGDDGKPYYHFPSTFSSETDWARSFLPVRGSDEVPFAMTAASSGLRYMALDDNPGPGYNWRGFYYPRDKQKLVKMNAILDPASVDLTAFRKRGGKLIIVHGWADALVSAEATIDWFEKMQKFMGGREATADFAQLYVVPGIHHGEGGPGPYVFDAQSALVNWVERGVAPGQLLLSDEADRKPAVRTRPAFPYPDIARYKGIGDPDSADSFERVRR